MITPPDTHGAATLDDVVTPPPPPHTPPSAQISCKNSIKCNARSTVRAWHAAAFRAARVAWPTLPFFGWPGSCLTLPLSPLLPPTPPLPLPLSPLTPPTPPSSPLRLRPPLRPAFIQCRGGGAAGIPHHSGCICGGGAVHDRRGGKKVGPPAGTPGCNCPGEKSVFLGGRGRWGRGEAGGGVLISCIAVVLRP